MAYQKPVIAAMNMDSEACGCNFYFDDAGQGYYFYPGSNIPQNGSQICLDRAAATGGAACVPLPGVPQGETPSVSQAVNGTQNSNVAGVGDHGASVTPLAGSGLPLTAPIHFGVPVGTEGVHANVTSLANPSLSAAAAGSSASAGYAGGLQSALAISNPSLSGLHLFVAGQQIF